MNRNVLITVEYDGSGFHGWQIQPHSRTVQGELTHALSIVCGENIQLNGTSRTDAGVHAYGQAASFTGDFEIPAGRITVAANNILSDIKVVSACDMPEHFHARFESKGKTYLYRISTVSEENNPDIFMRNYRYMLSEILDINLMREAAGMLIGTHDFSAFKSASGNPDIDPVKTVSDIDIKSFTGKDTRGKPITEYEIRVTGSGFLYNMVRIIVGTLVETGRGKRTPHSVAEILAAKDRQAAGHTAPAEGLWLEQVYFNEY